MQIDPNCEMCEGDAETWLHQRNELLDALQDCLNQACGEWTSGVDRKGISQPREFKGYDSMCISAYERGLSLLVELGAIKKEEVLR